MMINKKLLMIAMISTVWSCGSTSAQGEKTSVRSLSSKAYKKSYEAKALAKLLGTPYHTRFGMSGPFGSYYESASSKLNLSSSQVKKLYWYSLRFLTLAQDYDACTPDSGYPDLEKRFKELSLRFSLLRRLVMTILTPEQAKTLDLLVQNARKPEAKRLAMETVAVCKKPTEERSAIETATVSPEDEERVKEQVKVLEIEARIFAEIEQARYRFEQERLRIESKGRKEIADLKSKN